MRAFMVAVDYDDLVAVTIPYNRHHFDEVWVVTSHQNYDGGQHELRRICADNRIKVYVTDAFYRDGAVFNKWAALERCLDYAGRKGWMCLMDADVLWPKDATFVKFPGNLYTPRRRMAPWPIPGPLIDPTRPIPAEDHWVLYPLHPQQREFAGYTQIFHADDPALGPPPWHQTDWKHAGGADSFFQAKWPEERKVRPPFDVLHLGDAGANWCGRATQLADGSFLPGSHERVQQVKDFIRSRKPDRDPAVRFAAERLGPT